VERGVGQLKTVERFVAECICGGYHYATEFRIYELEAFSMLVYVKLVLTALFWGGTFIAARVVTREIDAYSVAFLRFLTASVILVAVSIKVGGRPACVKGKHILQLFVLGLTGVFAYNVFFFKGLKVVEAGRAALIVATCPVFITAFSAVFLKEKLSFLKLAGIFISLTGAVIVITRGDFSQIAGGSFGLGELYILGCVMCWVVYSLVGRQVMKELSPLAAVAYSSVVGTVLLFFPAVYNGLFEKIVGASFVEWICIGYLAVFGTVVGFVWYYEGVRRIGAVRAGLFINLVPVSGVALGFLILNEPVSFSLAVGGVLVITGVYMTNKQVRKRT
jgi:drug/metabolite transporter (DMT)-like permease